MTKAITQETINAYALAGGDSNPLHTDPAFAANTQFGGTIAHGMLVLALVSEAMTAAHGLRWAATGTLKVRWRAPALPPLTVTARAEPRKVVDGVASYDVSCEDEAGVVLLTGTASVALGDA